MEDLKNIQYQKPIVFISLSNKMGGAEQILTDLSNTTNSTILYIKKVKNNEVRNLNLKKSIFITKFNLIIGFFLLLKNLYRFRSNYVIFTSHAYLNSYIGFLKRIGFIKSSHVARESTSLFSRYKGFKRLSYKLCYNLGYKNIDLVICQTEEMKNQLMHSINFLEASNVIVMRNPLNLLEIKSMAKNGKIEKFLSNYICAAGRLIPIKGFDKLIIAFKNIVILDKTLQLIILGDGSQRDELLNIIKENNLLDNVFLLGHKDNPFPYFASSRLNVVSSIKEGFPNTLLQMLALNPASISTNCADGLVDIPNLSLFKAANIESFTELIKESLNFKEDYLEKCRKSFENYVASNDISKFIVLLFDNFSQRNL